LFAFGVDVRTPCGRSARRRPSIMFENVESDAVGSWFASCHDETSSPQM
jgi:hypothetical protein